MNLLKFVGEIFGPAAKLVDDLHTSTEEKLAAKAQLLETQVKFLTYALDYESKQLEVKGAIIVAEAKSEHWLTSTWRPITMLTLLALIVLDQTGQLAFRLADQAWTLIQIGLGGYVVGRSAEKVVPKLVEALKSREEI